MRHESTFPYRVLSSGWRGLVVATAIVLCAAMGYGADKVDVSVQVSDETVSVGGAVDYEVVLRSTSRIPRVGKLRIVRMPEFRGLTVRSGPGSSSRSQIINGAMDASLTLTWRLLAEQEGEASISAGEIEYDGKRYALAAQRVKVVKSSQEALPEVVRDGSVLAPQSEHESLNKQLAGRLFARLELSDTEPWLKETIVASCYLYVDRSLSGALRDVGWEPPAWEGFFSEEVPLGDLRLAPRKLGGKQYMAVELGRFLLTPTQTGERNIPLSEGQCAVRVQGGRSRRSFQDSFFGFGPGFDPFDSANRVPVRLPVAGRTVTVRALPSEGRPPSFGGAVGNFAVTGGVDRRKMTQDDILTLRIEVGGEGYLGSIVKPKLPEMPGWRLIDEQVNLESPRRGREGPETSSMGKKMFEYLLRPEKSGKLRVPAVAYAAFSPREERYIEEVVGPFEIDVAKGKQHRLIVAGASQSPVPDATAAPEREAPQVYGERLAYIHVGAPGAWPIPLYMRDGFLVLQVLPLLILGGAGGMRLWRHYRLEHADTLRYRTAGSRARRELRGARAALKGDAVEAFWEALGEALRGYVAMKLNRPASGLTLDEIERVCREKGADAEDSRAFRGLIERCDQARYMGRVPREAAEESLEVASALLRKLDKVL